MWLEGLLFFRLRLILFLIISGIVASCSNSVAQEETAVDSEGSSKAEQFSLGPPVHVSLITSDSRVKFTGVSSQWGDLDVEGLGTPEIKYTLKAEDDHGVECDIELIRLFTSNKAIIVPSGNVCTTSPLEIDISWPHYNGEPLNLQQADFRWGLHEVPPTEGFPFTIDRLSYSLPETDNIALSMQCTRGSQSVQLQFEPGANADASIENTPTIDFISQDKRDPNLYRFSSDWSYVDMGDGFIGIPTVYENLNHPFFSELQKDTGFDLIVEGPNMPVFRIDTKTDKKTLKQFLQLCGSEKK